jgi:hypothetical protein
MQLAPVLLGLRTRWVVSNQFRVLPWPVLSFYASFRYEKLPCGIFSETRTGAGTARCNVVPTSVELISPAHAQAGRARHQRS